jgi:hypothetical protein
MKKCSFITAALLGAAFAASAAAAQPSMLAKGEGTNIPDRVGPALVGAKSARTAAGPVTNVKAKPAFPAALIGNKVAITTYHYDNLRTGWNNYETVLTPANVSQSTFGPTGVTVGLDDQIDAQPLIVPNVTITAGPYAGSVHDVVYLATESNSIYAIDAADGTVLLRSNLGPPVTAPSVNCYNNGPNIGITETPVIDLAAQTLYVIAYVSTGSSSPPIYQLHALNLSNLTDNAAINGGKPVTVAASHVLSDGSTFTFNATYQRLRAALIENYGNIYAAFASFCDANGDRSRGWVLGWNAATLQPLPANQLNDTKATDPGVTPPVFLSSVWMSGYGIAASGSRLYFTTSNSDCNIYVTPTACPATSSWDGKTNIQESAVRIEGDLTHLLGVWSPANRAVLDRYDGDLGSGGLLLLPTYPYLAVTGGKDGNLLLLQRPDSGGLSLADVHTLDPCWCGPSYFRGPDYIHRVVTSHGATVQTWRVQFQPSVALVPEGAAGITPPEEDGGFFTTVSSNGLTPNTGIIWAVGRPTGAPGSPVNVNLYAFDAAASGPTLKQLYSLGAGQWPNTGGNSNIVPVVANGKVYVASAYLDASSHTRGILAIFGLGGHPFSAAQAAAMVPKSQVAPLSSPYVVSGTLVGASGSTLTLKTRSGKSAKADISQAVRGRKLGVPLTPGTPLTVVGSSLNSAGELVAAAVVRAKGSSGKLWPPDTPNM